MEGSSVLPSNFQSSSCVETLVSTKESNDMQSLERVKRTKDEGNSRFKEGKLSEAQLLYSNAFEECLRLETKLIKDFKSLKLALLLNLSITTLKMEQPNSKEKAMEALKYADAALRLDPNGVKPLYRRAQALMAMERIEEAQADLIKAAQLDPTDGAIRRELELSLVKMSKKKERLKDQESKKEAIECEKNEFDSDLKQQIEELRYSDFPFPPLWCKMTGEVPHLHFEDPKAMELIRSEQPVVLKGLDLTRSASQWTLDYLAENMMPRNDYVAYESESNLFMYYEDSNKGPYKFVPPTRKLSTSIPSFSSMIEKEYANEIQGLPHKFCYLQQTLYTEAIGEKLLKDVKSFNWNWVFKIADDLKMSNMKANVLWIGMRGVVTPGHYDEAHNFFSQIRGRKRFNLFSPSMWSCMYAYPYHHPADRQSRVNFYEKNAAFSKFAEAQGVTATLEAGDVLYLPPYWWHHVESLTESVGLNFWIEMSKENSQAVTLSPSQLVAIRRNVEKFIGTVIPPQQLGSFLQELVEGRFDLDCA
eukprot:TRINITY_DN10916_c0_g1_i1.p1 TRINITY_DN10916_c0_g1~~TRINITY_DN10916_c0_g1_i1.p1  ORF type:complete len:532 (-),score=120.86 TRINITY_DN10916_c0_g1_i1:218-1813(-)